MSRKRLAALVVGAATAIATGVTSGLGPVPGGASSHREAPLLSQDPTVDGTDFYMFVSPTTPGMVTLISNWTPFQEPAGGPNFYPFDDQAVYDFRIDNDGDARADLIYRVDFTDHYRNKETFLYNTGQVTSLTDPDLNFYQTYDVTRRVVGRRGVRLLVNDAISVPSHVGEASMPGYAADLWAAGVFAGGGVNAWAGQADDSFFLDLRVFDLLYGGNFGEVGDDTLAGFNVSAIALEIPMEQLARSRNPEEFPIIGAWSTASRRSERLQRADGRVRYTGDLVQVSRLGSPLVNEVVIPVGKKDFWNGTAPHNDLANFATYVVDPELPKLIDLIYGIPAPPTPRDDLVQVFVTGIPGLNEMGGAGEMLRLNMSIPPCEPPACGAYSPLGVIGGDVAGYPNGRRLADDTIDISLQVVEGEIHPTTPTPNDLADGVDENDVAFEMAFPYLGLPHPGSLAAPHP